MPKTKLRGPNRHCLHKRCTKCCCCGLLRLPLNTRIHACSKGTELWTCVVGNQYRVQQDRQSMSSSRWGLCWDKSWSGVSSPLLWSYLLIWAEPLAIAGRSLFMGAGSQVRTGWNKLTQSCSVIAESPPVKCHWTAFPDAPLNARMIQIFPHLEHPGPLGCWDSAPHGSCYPPPLSQRQGLRVPEEASQLAAATLHFVVRGSKPRSCLADPACRQDNASPSTSLILTQVALCSPRSELQVGQLIGNSTKSKC